MMKIIFILTSCLSHFNYITTNYAQNYGIARVKIPKNPESAWRFSIQYRDGTTQQLNLTPAEGLLIDNNTPAWYARGSRSSDHIDYKSSPILEKLGKFVMYQDYKQKAAVVVFHDTNMIKGFVGFYHFKLRTSNQNYPSSSVREYVLIPDSNYDASLFTSDVWTRDRVELNNNEVSRTVYPQLLIQLDKNDISHNPMENLRQMIAYFNAVDMLYSQFTSPRIKINIAGVILPMNEYAVPWYQYGDGVNDVFERYTKLFKHFDRYADVFPDDSYDMMFAFIGDQYNKVKLGFTQGPVECDDRYTRVGLLRNNLNNYLTGAHELGHSFSAEHDSDSCGARGLMNEHPITTAEMFEWTSCSKNAFHRYFSRTRGQCLNNCPRTQPNCPQVQAKKNSKESSIEDFIMEVIRKYIIVVKAP